MDTSRCIAYKIKNMANGPQPRAGMRLLDALQQDVLALGLGRRVRNLSPAAERLLGLSADLILSQTKDKPALLQDGISYRPLSRSASLDSSTPPRALSGILDLLLCNDGTSWPIRHSASKISTDNDNARCGLLSDETPRKFCGANSRSVAVLRTLHPDL